VVETLNHKKYNEFNKSKGFKLENMIFENKVKAEEKALELLKLLPSGFEHSIHKKLNSEEYFIAAFKNNKLNLQLTFLNKEWYASHLIFEDVRGFSKCPIGAIKSARQSLLKKINECENELALMKESKNKDWLYGLN
jgi:hypothetical protein